MLHKYYSRTLCGLMVATVLFMGCNAPVRASAVDRGDELLHSIPQTGKLANTTDDMRSEVRDHHPRMRTLQQNKKSAEIVQVTTPQQLLDSVLEGSLYTEVLEHLDLTTVQPSLISEYTAMMYSTRRDVGQSIKGNCNTKPSAEALGLTGSAPLRGWRPGQCVIITDLQLLDVQKTMWLDNLYIRHHNTFRTDTLSLIWCETKDCRIWMTRVTMQGDDSADPQSLEVQAGQLYADGLQINDFSSDFPNIYIGSGATVTLENSVVSRNTVSHVSQHNAIIDVNSELYLGDYEVVVYDYGSFFDERPTLVRLNNCTFSDNKAPYTLTSNSVSEVLEFDVQIYSDVQRPVNVREFTSLGSTLPLEQAPSSRPGIDDTSPWLLDAQEAFSTTSTESGGTDIIPIVAGTVAAMALLLAGACMFVFVRHRRRGDAGKNIKAKESDQNASYTLAVNSAQASTGHAGTVQSMNAVHEMVEEDDFDFFALCPPDKGTNQFGKMQTVSPQQSTAGSEVHRRGLSPGRVLSVSSEMTAQTSLAHGHSINAAQIPKNAADVHKVTCSAILSDDSTGSEITRSTEATHECQTSLGTVKGPDAQLSALDSSIQGSSSMDAPLRTSIMSTDGACSHNHTGARQINPSRTSTFTQSVKEYDVPRRDIDTFDMSETAPTLLQPPSPGASLEHRMDFLQQQLDSFGSNRPALPDLVLLGNGERERLQGGQAIVQIARSPSSGLEYAIKFFATVAAYKVETDMYQRQDGVQSNDLAQFLPQVLATELNSDGNVKDANGHPLPPYIVMERGESLDLWEARARPDRPQAFMMITQIANRIVELHKLGYVHRDLKPGNVMWLPRENRWTIIDFGCAALTGESARICFSLAYAAPEIISAYRRGDQYMEAQEAGDVWSLGVMAFELLTGRSAFNMALGKEKVMDRIEGVRELKLPWDSETMTAQDRRKLGAFRGSIMSLLARDPAKRPSMKHFFESCNRIMSGSTSVQV